MLKRWSIFFISIVFLSCFYLVSCKSRSVESYVYLVIDPSSIDNKDIKPYLTKRRIVANSTNQSCPADKKIVTLGAATDENNIEKSFSKESNFVDKNDTTSMIRLYQDCFPYNITIGYWCKAGPNPDKQTPGLCYKGGQTATTKSIVDINGTKQVNLKFSLDAQGNWKYLRETINLITEAAKYVSVEISTELSTPPLLLSDILKENCVQKKNGKYNFLLQKYLTKKYEGRYFYYLARDCSEQKLLYDNGSFNCTSPSTTTSEGYFNFDDDTNLNKIKKSAAKLLIGINIGGTNFKFSDRSTLEKVLQTPIDNKSIKIYILTLPHQVYGQNTDNTYTTITCTPNNK